MSHLLSVSNYLSTMWSLVFLSINCELAYEEFSTFHHSFSENSPEILGNFKPPSPFEYPQLNKEHLLKTGISQSPLKSTMLYTSICSEDHERFDPKTGKCFTVGTTGPCGPYMIFTGNEYLNPNDKVVGHCECDNDSYDRPLVSVGNQCHFLYTQAICPSGYWLIASENRGPFCKPNPCKSKMVGIAESRSVYLDGECVKLRSPSKLCKNKNEIVLFAKGSLKPICGQSKARRRIYKRQISKVNALKCQPGTIWSRITHKCRPVLQSKVIRE